MKRVLCVYFPKWPLQRLRNRRAARGEARMEDRGSRIGDCKPARSSILNPRSSLLAISAPGARGPQVVLCSAGAEQCGIRPGLPLAEATALAPRLQTFAANPAEDRRCLERLAEWMNRFSPCVGLEELRLAACG